MKQAKAAKPGHPIPGGREAVASRRLPGLAGGGLWLLALAIMMALVAACGGDAALPEAATASPLPAPTATPEATVTPTFQPDMATFEEVWKTVRDGFYDPEMNGVDWQEVHELYEPRVAAAASGEAYYRLLNNMLFELGVSHVGLLPPEMGDELEPITFPAGSLGFDVRLLDGEMVVTSVQAASPAAAAGLRPGYVILNVDGQTPEALLNQGLQMPPLNERDGRGLITQAVRRLLYGEPGQEVTIAFLDGNDQAGEVSLAFTPRIAKQTQISPELPPAYVEFMAERLSADIGYVRFSGFLPGVEVEAAAAVDEMADTRSLIIDLRGNPGGVFPVRIAIAGKLVGRRVLFLQYQQRQRLEKVYLEAVASPYQGNVVILIDEPVLRMSEVKGDPVLIDTVDSNQTEAGEERPIMTIGLFRDEKTRAIESFERQYVQNILNECSGNVSLAARKAGKERRAFGKLLKKYGINRHSFLNAS